MIKFDKKNQIFYLNTKSTTYAFGIFKDTVLLHLYWGELLHTDLNMQLLCSEFKRRALTAKDFGMLSSDTLPLEFSTSGSTDLRIPAFRCIHNDGSRISKFKYVDYEIVMGKPVLEGLPATYCEANDKTDTLIVHLYDELKNLHIYLSYSVFEDFDAITRSIKIVNEGEKINLTDALSMSLDFYGIPQSDIIHLGAEKGRLHAEKLFMEIKILKADAAPAVYTTILLLLFVIRIQMRKEVTHTASVLYIAVILLLESK